MGKTYTVVSTMEFSSVSDTSLVVEFTTSNPFHNDLMVYADNARFEGMESGQSINLGPDGGNFKVVDITTKTLTLRFYDSLGVSTTRTTTGTMPEIIGMHESVPGTERVEYYAPLLNYEKVPYSGNYSAFRTSAFGSTFGDRPVDLELQYSYDASVNMIFTSEGHVPRIVNSRFYVGPDDVPVLINRDGDGVTNIYNSENIDNTELILRYKNIPKLQLDQVKTGGTLTEGGYKYFFRYVDGDGMETDVIEESGLVPIAHGTTLESTYTTSDSNDVTNKAVQFSMSDCDTSFYGIQAYYTRSAGSVDPVVTSHKINSVFKINESGTCVITHSGYESNTLVELSEISKTYQSISSVRSLSKSNNRLLLTNTESANAQMDLFEEAALRCFIYEEEDSTKYSAVDDYQHSFANPAFAYNNTGVWPGETYELGINFITKQGVSPSYPLNGFDNINGDITVSNAYDTYIGTSFFGTGLLDDFKYVDGKLFNTKGVYRTKKKYMADMKKSEGQYAYDILGTYLRVDTSEMTRLYKDLLADAGVIGFFISRKDRIKDCDMMGWMTQAATTPASVTIQASTGFRSFKTTDGYTTYGTTLGYGYGADNTLYGNYSYFPAPLCMVGMSVMMSRDNSSDDNNTVAANFPFHLMAPVWTQSGENIPKATKFPFYSPDIVCNLASAASKFNSSEEYSLDVSGDGVTGNFDTVTAPYAYGKVNSVAVDTVNPSVFNPGLTVSGVSPNKSFTDVKMTYIPFGYKNVVDGGFTAKLDREYQLSFAARVDDDSAVPDKRSPRNKVDHDDGAYGTLHSMSQPTGYGNINTVSEIADAWAEDNFPDDDTRFLAALTDYAPFIVIDFEGSEESQTFVDDFNLDYSTVNEPAQTNYYMPHVCNIAEFMSDNPSHTLGTDAWIYNNNTGEPISQENWILRYGDPANETYFQVANRVSLEDAGDVVNIDSGGDCYFGVNYQKVFTGVPLAEAPQARDPYLYKSDLTGFGIADHGMVIGFPCVSSFNFCMRGSEEADAVEKEIYGKDRGFYPKDQDVVSNFQAESGTMNLGVGDVDNFSNPTFEADPDLPFVKSYSPNRVYASAPYVPGNFSNGFRDFSGIEYSDYGERLGPIVATETISNHTVLVHSEGVYTIEVSERSLVSSGTTAIHVDSTTVLPPKGSVLSEEIGSQHMYSVIKSESSIYGVDLLRRKIWRFSPGQGFKVISETMIQSLLSDIFDNEVTDIFASYDTMSNEVYFSFINNSSGIVDAPEGSLDNIVTIVFSETQNVWLPINSMPRRVQYESKGNRYLIDFGTSDSSGHRVLKSSDEFHSTIKDRFNAFHVHRASIEFIINHEKDSSKYLTNLSVIGTGIPDFVDITPDTSESMLVRDIHDFTYYAEHIPRNVGTAVGVSEDGFTLTINFNNSNYKMSIGEPFMLYNKNTKEAAKFIVTYNNDDGTVVLNKKVVNVTITPDTFLIIKGWKSVLAKSVACRYNNKTELSVPSRLTNERMQGNFGQKDELYDAAIAGKPYGRWMKVKLDFDGTDPLYVDSINSQLNLKDGK